MFKIGRSEDVQHLSTQVKAIPVGITAAILITQESNQISLTMKYLSGGSLVMLGVTMGVTLGGSSLLSSFSNMLYYPVSQNEVLNIDGPARFYLASLGSTVSIGMLRGKSS